MEERIVQNFKLIDKLGEGGMGEVYRGLDIMLEREVAIKVLRPELMSRQDVVERFRSEAIALAKLNHPNIATLYSFFCFEEQFFMVMEYVKGRTLDHLIRQQGALPWPEATRLICQVLEGLEHAHQMGIIHRDIKPSNLILTPEGSLKLMDFGIARILQTARLTQIGHLVGTLEYISPEQIEGKDTDRRSDIYSLGAVFYEMLTGHIPFRKNTDYELIRAQIEETPQPPSKLTANIPPALEQAVLRALAKNPADRFADAAAYRSALENILDTISFDPTFVSQDTVAFNGPGIKGKISKTIPPFLRTWWERYPGVVVLAILGTIAMVLLGIAFYNFSAGSLKPGDLRQITTQNAVPQAPAVSLPEQPLPRATTPSAPPPPSSSGLPPKKLPGVTAQPPVIPHLPKGQETVDKSVPGEQPKRRPAVSSPTDDQKPPDKPVEHQQEGWSIRK